MHSSLASFDMSALLSGCCLPLRCLYELDAHDTRQPSQTWGLSPAQTEAQHANVQMEGVEGYFDHKDVPGDNMMGPIVHDEEVFATRSVTCVGQVGCCLTRDTCSTAPACCCVLAKHDMSTVVHVKDVKQEVNATRSVTCVGQVISLLPGVQHTAASFSVSADNVTAQSCTMRRFAACNVICVSQVIFRVTVARAADCLQAPVSLQMM